MMIIDFSYRFLAVSHCSRIVVIVVRVNDTISDTTFYSPTFAGTALSHKMLSYFSKRHPLILVVTNV